jgi:hypothetical protein
MSKISTLISLLKNNPKEFGRAFAENMEHITLFRILPDKAFLRLQYRMRIGKKLNLHNPLDYTEKLQWIKLYYRKPEMSTLVDKYRVREYIKNQLGEEYLIPLIGKWDKVEDIDFSSLPDEFVLKCNHDSGSVIICKDKKEFNIEEAKKKLRKKLHDNNYYLSREWPYKNVKPCIICEKYMKDDDGSALTDYKFFCFNGEPKIMYWSKDKADDPKTDFFDMDYNHLPIRMRDPNAAVPPPKPKKFEEMKKLAKKLAGSFPHVRVDFYEINNHIYFGELTFFHCEGMVPVQPVEWNRKLGDWITLPKE